MVAKSWQQWDSTPLVGKVGEAGIRIQRSVRALLKLNSVDLVRERTIPTERPPLLGEVSANFADRGCRVGSVTDSHGR
jgi:hypothetical protein